MRPSPALVVAILALVMATTGAAFAVIPDSGGVIHACYAGTNGALRVVDSESECGGGDTAETAIRWNQTGPPGAQGPAGPQGPQGPAGPPGPTGTQGGLTVKHWAEVDHQIGVNAPPLAMNRSSVGVRHEFHRAYGSSIFTFPEDVVDCTAVASHLHRIGNGGPAADRRDSPEAGNDSSIQPPNVAIYMDPARPREVQVVTRVQMQGGRDGRLHTYVSHQPFALVLLCPPPTQPVYVPPATQQRNDGPRRAWAFDVLTIGGAQSPPATRGKPTAPDPGKRDP